MTTETAEIGYDIDRDQDRAKAVYSACTFLRVEQITITEKATNEQKPVWRWVFVDAEDQELDTITGTNFKPRTNALKFFSGILGRPPKSGDKPSDLYGKLVDIVWGENQGGKLTITDILPYKAPKGA